MRHLEYTIILLNLYRKKKIYRKMWVKRDSYARPYAVVRQLQSKCAILRQMSSAFWEARRKQAPLALLKEFQGVNAWWLQERRIHFQARRMIKTCMPNASYGLMR